VAASELHEDEQAVNFLARKFALTLMGKQLAKFAFGPARALNLLP